MSRRIDWDKAKRRDEPEPPKLGAMTDKRRRFLKDRLTRLKREAEQRRRDGRL